MILRFLCLSLLAMAASAATAFDSTLSPFLKKNCVGCHNSRMQSGSVNLQQYKSLEDLEKHRDVFEVVLRKVTTGEMPPAPLPKPADAKVIVGLLEKHFDKLDRSVKPDPGRVTARRLNRMEYNNTIRDLLGIDFQPAEDFPSDDSGYGFDNIGDVLTLSPILMEKYFNAAEQIARRAINTEPLPKPVKIGFGAGRVKGRRANIIEISHVFPAAGMYEVMAALGGPAALTQPKPVELSYLLDRKPVASATAAVAPKEKLPSATVKFFVPTPGTMTLRVQFDPTLIPNAADEVNDKTLKDFTLLLERTEIRGPYEPVRTIPETQKRLIACAAEAPGCARTTLTNLARRAWRRPLQLAEGDKLMRVFEAAVKEGDSFEQGIQAGVQAILVSPHFLFRLERGSGVKDKNGDEALSDLELASRLSYFLWSSMPDETLLKLAEARQLSRPATLNAQVLRMLKDPKADALADGFAGQWLQYRNLDLVRPDPERFPAWKPELKWAMQEETRLVFLDALRSNQSVPGLLDSRTTFLNETLAKHYGIPGVAGKEFRKVTLPDGRRGGLLSMGSVLTVSSYPTRTSPVIRGKWVLENILNAPPPPPPPDVPTLDEKAIGTKLSLRDQMKAHRSNPSCASCHARMDVLGFGLENYDAIGAWREKDGNFALDASGTLPNGQSFAGPEALKKILAADPKPFTAAFAEKLMTFALGRGVERGDRVHLNNLLKATALQQNRMQSFILEIVKSAPFQKRRPEAPKS
jgi:hypothetical protein